MKYYCPNCRNQLATLGYENKLLEVWDYHFGDNFYDVLSRKHELSYYCPKCGYFLASDYDGALGELIKDDS